MSNKPLLLLFLLLLQNLILVLSQDLKATENGLRQKLKDYDMVEEEKMNIPKVTEFSVLPHSWNWELKNLRKFSFGSSFDNSRFKSNKKMNWDKNWKVLKWFKKNKLTFLRFPSFQLCPTPKIENLGNLGKLFITLYNVGALKYLIANKNHSQNIIKDGKSGESCSAY